MEEDYCCDGARPLIRPVQRPRLPDPPTYRPPGADAGLQQSGQVMPRLGPSESRLNPVWSASDPVSSLSAGLRVTGEQLEDVCL